VLALQPVEWLVDFTKLVYAHSGYGSHGQGRKTAAGEQA
jgi:hypothetical protein